MTEQGVVEVAGGLPAVLQRLLSELQKVKPHDWVGSPGGGKHFERVTAADCGVREVEGAPVVWVRFGWTDKGADHVVEAVTPATHVGQHTADQVATLDGGAVPGGYCVWSHRQGLDTHGFYWRLVIEFKAPTLYVRFDGDLL